MSWLCFCVFFFARLKAMAMEAMRKQQAAFAMHAGLGGLESDIDGDEDANGDATENQVPVLL